MSQQIHESLKPIHRTWRIVGFSMLLNAIALVGLAVFFLSGAIPAVDVQLIAYVFFAVSAIDLVPAYFCLLTIPRRLEEATRLVQRAVPRRVELRNLNITPLASSGSTGRATALIALLEDRPDELLTVNLMVDPDEIRKLLADRDRGSSGDLRINGFFEKNSKKPVALEIDGRIFFSQYLLRPLDWSAPSGTLECGH